MMSVEDLKQFLESVSPGTLDNTADLGMHLKSCWKEFDGHDNGGMKSGKLGGRMEDVHWKSPVLSFSIKRHGAAACGSSRAEVQHWEVDVVKQSATIVGTGTKQIRPQASPVTQNELRELTKRLVTSILRQQTREYLKWKSDGSVEVQGSLVFRNGTAAKETLAGRRKRLYEEIQRRVASHGWQRKHGGHFVHEQPS